VNFFQAIRPALRRTPWFGHADPANADLKQYRSACRADE
jgi:hypothetical protein